VQVPFGIEGLQCTDLHDLLLLLHHPVQRPPDESISKRLRDALSPPESDVSGSHADGVDTDQTPTLPEIHWCGFRDSLDARAPLSLRWSRCGSLTWNSRRFQTRTFFFENNIGHVPVELVSAFPSGVHDAELSLA
jgi:hypothetical protein